MGLRLYQPPVESDIQPKPAVDWSARSRSNIRRALDRNDERIRERRRRVLAATAAHNNYDARRAAASQPATRVPATTDSTGTRSGSEHARRALLVTDRPGALLRADGTRIPAVPDDRAVAMFGERWAHLHAESTPNLFRDDDNDPSPTLTMAVEPDFLSRRSQPRPEPTYALSNLRSTQAPGHPSRSATRPHSTLWSRIQRRHRSSLRDESRPSPQDDASDGPRPRPPPPPSSSARPWAIEAADMDGLGDRNRSLSPEGDNLWGTLLTTLTPDPQPPSVGSSFASASASAAATQSTAAASSRTSFTAPDAAAEESAFELPCESGCDNSDTEGEGEGDEEDEMDRMQLPYFPRLALASQSHADRARGNSEDYLELLGSIGGMQHIVRSLARREDIPDEWWAEAGLSRTLSREAGN
ncbi:hypothetical protein N658DRAFT_514031 [Parathielavia hyrcaniae]|uniref:Uncharacterized protein n=1 Tax=Parathielavia hyrcaniae TaxID=113614 RepID=A0AAN6T4L1_9PEZI|nr:hypothetical protein N658DRAFT_514031 [Parathielavia hyrcaniae]